MEPGAPGGSSAAGRKPWRHTDEARPVFQQSFIPPMPERAAGSTRRVRLTACFNGCVAQLVARLGPDGADAAAGIDENRCRSDCDKRHQQCVLDQVLAFLVRKKSSK